MSQQIDTQILHYLNYAYIKQEETESFLFAWETLVSRFNIPQAHHKPLLEIVSDLFEVIDRDTLYIYELNSSISAVNFLIEYTKRLDGLAKSNVDMDRISKVRIDLNQREIEFQYPDAASITVKAIYNANLITFYIQNFSINRICHQRKR